MEWRKTLSGVEWSGEDFVVFQKREDESSIPGQWEYKGRRRKVSRTL